MNSLQKFEYFEYKHIVRRRTVFSKDTCWWPTRHHYLSKPGGGGGGGGGGGWGVSHTRTGPGRPPVKFPAFLFSSLFCRSSSSRKMGGNGGKWGQLGGGGWGIIINARCKSSKTKENGGKWNSLRHLSRSSKCHSPIFPAQQLPFPTKNPVSRVSGQTSGGNQHSPRGALPCGLPVPTPLPFLCMSALCQC